MLIANFDMKDVCDASFVVGIEIHHIRSHAIVGLSQKGYIERVLIRFNTKSCKPCTALIQKGKMLFKTQCPHSDDETVQMEKVSYAFIISSLMYAQVCTRPDIVFVISVFR